MPSFQTDSLILSGVSVTASCGMLYVNGVPSASGGNVVNTGLALQDSIGSLSGFTTGMSGAIQSQIAGASAGVTSVNALSGALNVVGTGLITVSTGAPGHIIVSGDTSISGALTATGLQIGVVSGALAALLTATGQILLGDIIATSGSLANTGQTLYGNIVAANGSLANTGQVLYAYVTATSGFATGASGALAAGLTATGLQIGLVSGALAALLTATGTKLSAVQVSGSTVIGVANFTGLGGTMVLWSGNTVFVSGAVGAGGGVPSVNAITSAVTIAGAGGLSVSTAGSIILVSGDSSISGALTQTGLQIGLVSGALAALLAATGQQAWSASNANAIALSGNLTATGLAIGNVSGALATQLTLTGQQIGVISGAIAVNLTATGNALYAYVTTASGFATGASGYLNSVIANTGQQAWSAANANAIALSGNLTQTGVNLQGQINTLTTNLALTGSGLYLSISGLAGNLALTGSNLQTQIGTLTTSLASTGGQAWGAANTNAIALSGNLTATGLQIGLVSGALAAKDTLSGVALYAYITATSGFATGSSGYLGGAIASTGQRAWSAADTNARNISGDLTQTGVVIEGQIGSLSGWTSNMSGALQTLIAGGGSVVKVSGSSAIATANFTGIGTTVVLYSGGMVFVSGAQGGAGGGLTQQQVMAITSIGF